MSEKKEWTVMFFLASDNPLAPGVVSQLKALKQAGFHPEANVIAQFDPQTPGTPTHIFDVNLINKLKSHGAPNIGFAGNDPFVRNLLEDKLWRDQKNRDERPLRDEIKEVLEDRNEDIEYGPPIPPNDRSVSAEGSRGRSVELSPRQSLENFLKFCREQYPARHYMLFILGHGVVVGNDIFLFDEHVDEHTDAHSLSLVELGVVLNNFTREVKRQDSGFELVGFHSCSVSALEVAYELQGTAGYMLASQGPSFVGSWPYRQILIRLFNDLVRFGAEIDVKAMLGKIFNYCLYNSADFLLAGYSYDLCLCNLSKISEIKPSLVSLSEVLRAGLDSCLVRNLILLAHWRSQSYWNENYTDLADFCFCLNRLCEEHLCLHVPSRTMSELLRKIIAACNGVIGELTKEELREARRGDDQKVEEKIITRAEFAGPAHQYSRGLSLYFPWSRPSEDSQILDEYERYRVEETSWRLFLDKYFDATLRKTRKDEDAEEARRRASSDPCKLYTDGDAGEQPRRPGRDERLQELLEDVASLVYNEEGQLGALYALAKPDVTDPTGDECTALSIKNYPRDTRPRARRGRSASGSEKAIPLSSAFSRLFQED
ncbi:MAG TPA: clostripain-related cysteine peptidase [Pyrinomonadaceae bacterium]|jgi:hypothetical protein